MHDIISLDKILQAYNYMLYFANAMCGVVYTYILRQEDVFYRRCYKKKICLSTMHSVSHQLSSCRFAQFLALLGTLLELQTTTNRVFGFLNDSILQVFGYFRLVAKILQTAKRAVQVLSIHTHYHRLLICPLSTTVKETKQQLQAHPFHILKKLKNSYFLA